MEKVETVSGMAERVGALLPVICDAQASFGELLEAVDALHRELAAVAGITGVEDFATHGEGTVLGDGKAIGPAQAAQCVRETTRTAKFIRGIDQALRDLAARVDGPVRVLYAGCGPYGTLLLPLALRWPASRLRITLIDIHGFSLASAAAVARALGVSDRVEARVKADATTYRAEQPFHLGVSETMAQGLRNEPQLAIMRNLWPQMAPGGVCIPERITVSLQLVDGRRQTAQWMGEPEPPPRDAYPVVLDCGTVIEVSPQVAAAWESEPAWDGEATAIRCPTLVWPADAHPWRAAHVIARVHVYGDTILDYRESSITSPLPIRGAREAAPGARIAFQYRLGSRPEVRGRLA